MPLGERAAEPWVRERFAAARVARLGTATPGGAPHVVPVVFVLESEGGPDLVWIAVDSKPKSSRRLRRLANIEANPRVSVLVDHYDEDWDALWWVRADGSASIEDAGSREGASAVARLRAKYPQDAEATLGPLIRIEVDHWSGWSAHHP